MRQILHRLLFISGFICVMFVGMGYHAVAQLTGEWTAIDSIHQGRFNTNTIDVAAATAGDYVVMAQEDVTIGPYTVRRTMDGGKHWAVVRADSGNKCRYTGIAHPTPGLIIVIGDTTSSGGSSQTMLKPFVLRSTDGGTSWSRNSFPDGIYCNSLSMYDGESGAILGVLRNVAGQIEYVVFTTGDGGATWKRKSLPVEGTSYGQITCMSSGGIMILGYDPSTKLSVSVLTIDGGDTWETYPMPDGMASLDFVDSLTGWGAGGISTGIGDTRRDVIARTSDGGVTWKVVLDSSIKFNLGLTDIAFADAMHGIVVGGYGKILRTSDGGATWHRDWPAARLVAEYIGLGRVAYPVADEALATTNSGYILKYAGREKLAAPVIIEPANNQAELPLELQVKWTSIEGAESYDFQIGDTTYEYNFVDHHIFDVPYYQELGLTATAIAVQLQPHARYVFRVRARNASDTSDWSTYLYTISRDAGQTLSAPVFITPENGAKNVALPVRFEWAEIAGATGYDLTVAENPVYQGTLAVDESNIQGTSYTTSLQPGTTYYARVRARNATETGNWSTFNEGSRVFTVGSASGVVADVAGSAMQLTIVPNPVTTEHAILRMYTVQAGRYQMSLVNDRGEQLSVMFDGRLEAGSQSMKLDLGSVPSGCCFLRVEGPTGVFVKSIVVAR